MNPTPPSAERFVADALSNPFNRAILERLPDLRLPDAWLVAGCLFQTVWNLHCGRPSTEGIRDYDLFYFDDSDLSAQAEAAAGQRVEARLRDLRVAVEVKNQARVHTWYRGYFGHDYAASRRSRDGIDRFLVACTCVGLQPSNTGPSPVLYAPNGLAALYAGVLEPNPRCDHPALFARKAADYQARWPHLRIVREGRPGALAPPSPASRRRSPEAP